MAFRIVPNPEFTIAVALSVAGSDERGEIEVTFKYLKPDELAKLKKNKGENSVADSLRELIVKWSGVEDAEGKPVEYSKATLAQLLANYHAAGDELMSAYFLEVYGARRKN
jgi:hypothetical protein